MILLNGEEHDLVNGEYQLTYTMSAGTAELQQSVDGGPFAVIPDSAQTASTAKTAKLCTSKIKAVLTGDAALSINKIET